MPVSVNWTTRNISTSVDFGDLRSRVQESFEDLSNALAVLSDLQQMVVSNVLRSDGNANPGTMTLVDTSSASVTVTLPLAALNDGAVIILKKTSSDGNTMTAEAHPTESVNGTASTTAANGSLTLIASAAEQQWMWVS